MNKIIILSQLIIALGIFNVWLVRANKPTNYRGGSARTMEEEFHVYGLSTTCMKVVRVLKLLGATLLISGLWIPALTIIGAVSMAVLMLAAVLMHAKVRDPILKAVPAASLLLLSLLVLVFASTKDFELFGGLNPGTVRVSTENSKAAVMLDSSAVFAPATAEFKFKAKALAVLLARTFANHYRSGIRDAH